MARKSPNRTRRNVGAEEGSLDTELDMPHADAGASERVLVRKPAAENESRAVAGPRVIHVPHHFRWLPVTPYPIFWQVCPDIEFAAASQHRISGSAALEDRQGLGIGAAEFLEFVGGGLRHDDEIALEIPRRKA